MTPHLVRRALLTAMILQADWRFPFEVCSIPHVWYAFVAMSVAVKGYNCPMALQLHESPTSAAQVADAVCKKVEDMTAERPSQITQGLERL